MPVEVAIIVTDAPPLITLAAAQSLDYLLYPELPMIVPDAVFHEPTAAAGKLGAQEILEWYRAHMEQVRVEPTATFRAEIVLREKAILLTTWDYLRQLDEAQRIRSADAVMRLVRQAGRNPPQRDVWSDHDPEVRDAVRAGWSG
jgi:hypothetical protein